MAWLIILAAWDTACTSEININDIGASQGNTKSTYYMIMYSSSTYFPNYTAQKTGTVELWPTSSK